LTQSPPNETLWLYLVNEVGDIGLDSAFYADLDVAIEPEVRRRLRVLYNVCRLSATGLNQ